MANWRSFAPSWTKGTSRTHAQGKRGRSRKQLSHRSLQLQPLEERTVFAVGGGPTLLAVIPNEGALIVPNGPSLHIAPKDLTFRFDDGQVIDPTSLGAIQLTRSGPDRTLGSSDDVTITPGFVGIGETPNDVIVRFSETLPDDLYQVTIIGTGSGALRNTNGQTLFGGTQTRTFRLDLGAQITAVVPQPMARDAQGKLVQATNQIDIYFNDDNLNFNSAQNTTFYELILTQGTLTNTDDVIFNPTSVAYDASADKAVLNFAPGVLSTAGTWRLRVGNNDVLPSIPNTVPVPTDPGTSLTNALNVGSLGTVGQTTQSLILNSAIDAQPYTVLWPGGNDEPGHREIPLEAHLGGGDASGGIPRIPYNFQLNYGVDPFGNPLFNVITENQKQRAREIFAFYGYYLGVQFYETATSGLTIATGDIRAVDPTANTGPGGIAGIAGGGLAVMDNAEDWANSEYGGAWMSVAMHEIGHLLGQGHTYDLPSVTIQGSDPQFGSTESFFPGNADIVHGQRLYRPDSKDIDMYRFNLNQAGKVALETLAERLPSGDSGLDSVITVFDANGTIVARNDDYFSKDSYLELNLTAGQYYVTVSSTGNTSFDPKVEDSGMLGTTQGAYSLRINFTPDATGGLVDANGTMFDGDADGIPGGAYNFWFKTQSAANTLFVDKVATGGVGTLGSITNPYTSISLALAAAQPGQIVRIVGNGGADGNLATTNDNVAYNIGRDIFGASLSDGQRMDIPRNVTVMVDAGTLIKLRGANIEAGSQNSGVDRSGGALQILGTPARNATGADIGSVLITSFHNESLGTNSDNRVTTPGKGDWGGLVFREDSDLEQNGIFLSYVNHAKITYGGGQVPLSPSSPTFDPIHLIKARPNISFNTITNSAGAAMSADPDSFEETKFQNTLFTADYNRVGPAIHGNTIVTNTINGIFVRIRTLSNESIDLMTVPARFDDTDIVHVISENLIIKGSPGGGLQDPNTGVITARLNGRLKIDPGMIVKLDGARIETQFDAQLIAEGTASNRVIFTSLADDKYGAGGTFDTPNNGAIGAPTNVLPAAGNWGGLYVGPTSSANLDYALVTYGGGSTSVEGGFDNFNAIEVHQADLRISNSIIENSAGGAGGTRAGRGTNTATTIYALFSQPILVNNVIRHNAAAAISIDVNSLTYNDVNDTGRTTGKINLAGNFASNQGPLVNGNRLLDNGVNGMVVRGGPLTTEGVWDDTDIVHVVQSEIILPDHHTYSGLRLESNPTQSLVIKLQGATAGFTADGRPLDIDDRIGGTLQVLGRPGYPVVFTSLSDDSVGAGFDPSGKPVTDTNNNGNATVGTPGDWRSLRLDSMSNDRNVAVLNESEQTFAPGGDLNGIPENAQEVGGLAPNERSGDDNVRLGFEIHGLISQPGDVDVYKFKARAGTEVWLDIDRTSFALDTILELVDASGAVIARSDNSLDEEANPGLLVGPAGTVYTMTKSDFGFPDLYSMNTKDSGMRVVLPTGPDTINDYFVRVRSASNNLTVLTGGQSQGTYQLQIRLRQTDEKPGSVVGYADVRYATAGVEVLGKPEHSPILSESVETTGANDLYTTAQDLGNLMLSDRGTLSAGGNIQGVTDVDWFRFDLRYELVQNLTPGDKTLSAMFDIDYADGLGRPDTTMAVFDDQGRLILIARDSDIADDQPPPTATDAGKSDLDRGSFSKLDPYIGSVQMPENHTYYVAVFSNRQLPAVLDATFRGAATDPLIRMEPINSINRIVEDHIGSSGGSTVNDPATVLFPGTSVTQLNAAADPYTLTDVPFYVQVGSNVYTINPFTGNLETDINGNPPLNNNYGDIAMRSDGRLFGLTVPIQAPPTDANSGNYIEIAPSDGAETNLGDDNIVTYQIDPMTNTPPPIVQDIGVQFDGMTFSQAGGVGTRRLFAIGHRAPGNGVDVERNLLYRLDPNTGAAIDFFTPNAPRMPTDARQLDGGAGRPLVTAPTIITNDVTDTTGNVNNPGDVRDGITFTISDGINPSKTFEIDTGPDILFTTPATSGNLQGDILFRDGETFTLGATTYEFNSGPVVNIQGPGSNFIDGQAFTITDNNNISKTFEFDSDNTLINPANQRVAFTSGDSALQVAASLTAAISSAGLTVVATRANSQTTRITLQNDTQVTTLSPIAPNPTILLDGNYGASAPGRTLIPFEEIDTAGVIGPSIATVTGGAYARNRVNFPNANSANFLGLLPPNTGPAPLDPQPITLNTNVLGGTAAPGVVTPGAVRVLVRANQDSDALAIVLQNAINGQTSPTFRAGATAFGSSVSLVSTSPVPAATSLTVTNGGTVLTAFGAGPGGDVTGLAVLNGVMYAVSSGGGLFTVDNALLGGNGPLNNTQLTYITNSQALTGIQFSSLTVGPQTVENGRFANMLFATSTSGRLYAINPTAATPATMLQPIFVNGATSIQLTQGAGAVGIAFSPVDYNLWHVTNRRRTDVGHGITASMNNDVNRGVIGGMSYYFGLENPTGALTQQNGAANFSTNVDPVTGNNAVWNTYNVPNGANGKLTTAPFSLVGYAPTDKPTLYFNYYLETEGAESTPFINSMRDAFRVQISEDGVNWTELATNNSRLSGLTKYELSRNLYTSGGEYRNERLGIGDQHMQELFDNSNSWRQARVDLGDWAGLPNLRLRIDFVTAGSFNDGEPSDTYGDYFSNTKGQNNRFEGAYVDDFVIGFAERGEMVSSGVSNTNFFSTPVDPSPPGTQTLVGTYQLEIRRGTEYATQTPPSPPLIPPGIILINGFDTNDRFASGYTLVTADPSTIADGENFSLSDGLVVTRYEFDNNNSVTPGSVAIPFGGLTTAAQVANVVVSRINAQLNSKIRGSVTVTSNRVDLSNVTNVSGYVNKFDNLPSENDNTIPTAYDSGLSSASPGILTKSALIGDDFDSPYAVNNFKDTDFVRFQLDAGDTVLVDINTPFGGLSDSYLRIFDASGVQVAFNDDAQSPTDAFPSFDSYISFTAVVSGIYYVGVSGLANTFYNPFVENSGIDGATGAYDLVLTYGAPAAQIVRYDNKGETNLFRDQGYTLVHDIKVSNSLGFGIVVDAAPRTSANNLPHPESPRTLTVPSTQNLVPGISVFSNLLVNNGAGGILFSGDNNGSPLAAVPFGRILNNTIYGGTTANGIGISVTDRAGPTILNNIVVNSLTGVQVDASSGPTTVLGANVYQANGTNRVGAGETFAINAPATPSLFVNAATGNFYLAQGAPAVDSAIDSLPERASLKAVVEDVGIPQSPILAPNSDLFGQLRKDDDTTPNSGQGNIVFKDRGALERADFDGPISAMFDPTDNDVLGIDRDPAVNSLLLVGRTVSHFSVQLLDPAGVGIDDATVNPNQFVLTRDGLPLSLTNDFLFSYDTTNKIVRFDAAAGIWIAGTYKIQLINTATGIKDIAGNQLIPNNPNGNTEYTIVLTNSVAAPWQNPTNALDVNNDGFVSPIDALLVVNALNTLGAVPLPTPASVPPYIDVNGDGNLSAIDLLLVIAQLNAAPAQLQAAPLSSSAIVAADSAAESTDSSHDVAFAVSLAQSPVSSTLAASASNSTASAASTSSSAVMSSDAVSQALADDDFDYDPADLLVSSLSSTESDDEWDLDDILNG